ncbi:uncharacterized protein LOC135938919 [Cloeon dipterum]|uniref:uncharacterized protein LOC135938919 n=1 Tax=Cloeon dipterum TaxID=197152 RepID=UPI0032200556
MNSMMSETKPCGDVDDAIHELGQMSVDIDAPKPFCLRERLEKLRLLDRCERAALHPWNKSSEEAAGVDCSRHDVGQGQENERQHQWLNLARPSPLRMFNRLHRGSCPARLSQLSLNAHRNLKPYSIPWRREERVRTKSENSDTLDDYVDPWILPTIMPKLELLDSIAVLPDPTILRSRSLEDVRSPSAEEDLDDMSLEIQRLHVNE